MSHFLSSLPEPHDIAASLARQFDSLICAGEWKDIGAQFGSREVADAVCASFNANPRAAMLDEYKVFPRGRWWVLKRRAR